MEYDEIPDELEDNEIVIYEDTHGKIETDQYLRKDNAESFKAYLQSIGLKVYYAKDPDSFDVNRPFRYGKPFIQKRSVHEVDWENADVIKESLKNRATPDIVTKKLVELSKKVKIEDSKATGFTLQARYIVLDNAFQKWKSENNKAETPENRETLIGEFAEIYIKEQKTKKQKRVPVGANVILINEDKKKGKVLEYDEEESMYRIEDTEGFSSRYKRKEFEVVKDANNE